GSEATAAVDKTKNDRDEPSRDWGDDVVLTLTDTGSVVVTVGGHVVIDQRNPNEAQKGTWLKRTLRKINPVAKVKNAFRRSRSRRSAGSKINNDDSKRDSIVSNQYSLHVVADGFEVRLDEEFVWGWDVSTSR
ncbi:unnamed protein product, partial [Pylaiella littoralis]